MTLDVLPYQHDFFQARSVVFLLGSNLSTYDSCKGLTPQRKESGYLLHLGKGKVIARNLTWGTTLTLFASQFEAYLSAIINRVQGIEHGGWFFLGQASQADALWGYGIRHVSASLNNPWYDPLWITGIFRGYLWIRFRRSIRWIFAPFHGEMSCKVRFGIVHPTQNMVGCAKRNRV